MAFKMSLLKLKVPDQHRVGWRAGYSAPGEGKTSTVSPEGPVVLWEELGWGVGSCGKRGSDVGVFRASLRSRLIS